MDETQRELVRGRYPLMVPRSPSGGWRTCWRTDQGLSPDHFDKKDKSRIASRLKTRLEALGYVVQIAPVA